MPVVIDEFEVVAETPSTPPAAAAPAGAPPAPPTPHDLQDLLRRQAERAARVRAH